MKAQGTFDYKGKEYPEYIRQGNAVENILPIAKKFCKGRGLDIGGTPDWSFPGAEIINPEYIQYSASNFPDGHYDYIFSSHCLEHLPDYITAIKIWKEALRIGGQLFLYLPHPEMEYWLPQNNRKHLHQFSPVDMAKIVRDLGFSDIFYSERDLYWSFAVTGVKQ